jgi:hydroxymethylglutaryl-CoA lyase
MKYTIDFSLTEKVQIVEVAPRDGFQAVKKQISTETKSRVINELYQAGFERMEIGAFVSPKVLPQMADIKEIIPHIPEDKMNGASVLVPNTKGAELALAAGIKNLVYVISVSESHNQNNVRRSTTESFADFENLISVITDDDINIRLDLATSFDCPFEGKTAPDKVITAARKAIQICPDAELGICDTTGRATPNQVYQLFNRLMADVDSDPHRWAYHGHDTFGLGVTNAIHAYYAGVRVIETATAGLGGCPFAPGAKGNTATEDLVYAFHKMGVETGINLEKLLETSDHIFEIDPPSAGGRIRTLTRDYVLT